MVGRFIQQQQIGAANQRLRQVQSHAPATGEVADRALQLLLAEAQTVQQACGARMDTPRLHRIQLAMQQRDGVAIVTQIGVRQFRLQLAIDAVTVDDILQRGFVERRGFLIHPGQRPVCRKRNGAGIAGDFTF